MDGSAYNYGTTDGRAIAIALLLVTALIAGFGAWIGWILKGIFG
jgi:hypothetical protein